MSALLVIAAACSSDEDPPTPSPTPTTSSTVTSASGGSGGARMAECQDASECADPYADDCSVPSCDQGECALGAAPEGSPCAEGDGTVCDASGACVECIDDMGCPQTDFCDVDETTTCLPKIPLGQMCAGDNQCENDICTDGVCCVAEECQQCTACADGIFPGECMNLPALTDDACPPNQLCNGGGSCRNVVGTPCAGLNDCISEACGPNGTCLGAPGEACAAPADCASATCTNNVCE